MNMKLICLVVLVSIVQGLMANSPMLKGVNTSCQRIQNAGYCYHTGRDGFVFETECGSCICKYGDAHCGELSCIFKSRKEFVAACVKAFKNNKKALRQFLDH